jgi:hypothetical protein
MSYLNALLTDLRERKLWPVPLVLIAVLVAVPVLLSKSPAVQHPTPSLGLDIASTQSGNAVTVDSTPVQAPIGPGSRDPFTQQKLPSAALVKTAASTTGVTVGTTSASTASTTSGSSGSTASASTGTTSTSTGSGTSTGTGGGTTTTTTPTTTPTHKSAPAGLAATDAYHVAISITNKSSGVTPLDPFQRDGTLPNDQQPLLVELGVAKGARNVLFAVQPGAVVSGPGTCTPGPLDCELLTLAPGQTEGLSRRTASASVPVAIFQITGISVDRFASKAAAAKARAKTDAAGRKLLANSTSSTLSLFQYDPSLDAVVDERNLTVGGN